VADLRRGRDHGPLSDSKKVIFIKKEPIFRKKLVEKVV